MTTISYYQMRYGEIVLSQIIWWWQWGIGVVYADLCAEIKACIIVQSQVRPLSDRIDLRNNHLGSNRPLTLQL